MNDRLILKLLFGVSVVLFVVIMGIWGGYYANHTSISTSNQEIQFKIMKGDGLNQISDRLKQSGIIHIPRFFNRVVRYYNRENNFKYGTYRLSFPASLQEIMEQLQDPSHLVVIKLTIPEGMNMYELDALLAQKEISIPGEFIQRCTDSDFIRTLKLRYPFLHTLRSPNLEGFLFPDTYQIVTEISLDGVILMILDNFNNKVIPVYHQYQATLPKVYGKSLMFYDLMILASIVEREAVVNEDRPLIASVFLNRLNHKMALGSCPTVKYALKQFSKSMLTAEDISIESPYNTYRINGLPPTPISNPGISSILGVLKSTTTNYYYFISTNDGHHHFSRTQQEHNNWRIKLGYRS